MREVDRRTSELGVPGLVLMENAGQRVVEVLAHAYAPLRDQRIIVMCGKGNNGGDGLVVARRRVGSAESTVSWCLTSIISRLSRSFQRPTERQRHSMLSTRARWRGSPFRTRRTPLLGSAAGGPPE